MKVQESFFVSEPPDKLWAFLEQVDQVARCVPGVEAVEQIDDDNSRVRLTQAVGPMRATFDLKMRVTERRPQELMQFTAVGRAVRGAAGSVRSVNTVHLHPQDGGTAVDVEADMAMGGVLGSVGQKVVAKQAAAVTKAFSQSLERALKGEPEPTAAPAARAPAVRSAPAPAAAGAPRPATAMPEGMGLRDPRLLAGFGAGFGAGVALGVGLCVVLVRSLRRP